MQLNGETVGVGEPLEVITSKRRGAIPVVPVIRRADDGGLAKKFAEDVERLAEELDRTRSMLLRAGFGATLVLALTAAVVAKKAGSSDGQIEGQGLKPVEGLDYEDPVLDREVSCLRTEFKDRISGTTSPWKEENCDTDALDALDGLWGVFIARSNLGVDNEEWTRTCTGDTSCGMTIKVSGRDFSPSIDKRFVKPVPRNGAAYTRRIYSK